MEFIGRLSGSSENSWEGRRTEHKMVLLGPNIRNYLTTLAELAYWNEQTLTTFSALEMLHSRFKIPLQRLAIPSVGEEVGN